MFSDFPGKNDLGPEKIPRNLGNNKKITAETLVKIMFSGYSLTAQQFPHN